MIQSRRSYLASVGVVAWSATTAGTVLTILEAISFATTQNLLGHIAAASIALNVVSLCSIGLHTYQSARQQSSPADGPALPKALKAVSVALSGAALIFNLTVIILIKIRWNHVLKSSSAGPVTNWSLLVAAHIALWVVSCVTQAMLYTLSFWGRQTPKLQTVEVSGPRDSVISDIRSSQPSRNLFIMEPTQPSSPLAALPSPTFSTRSSRSLKSFRDSLRHAIRPATSRTTLISRPSFNRDARSIYSQSDSVDNVSHSDGFDSWDTSSVSLSARDAIVQTVPSKGTTLDPIPGSRPATPARALEGPFLSELPEEDEHLTPPPRLMPDVSRPPSPAVSEAHIHPLFRTESPVPPPDATPNTNIMASPLSNQAIACPSRPFNRMRSNSQLNQAQSSRARALSLQSISRSPSPPIRELTPPIPDFVLNSSPRSSLSGQRRVQLQYSPDR